MQYLSFHLIQLYKLKNHIFICCSPPGKSSPNFNFALGEGFSKLGYNVIYIIDQSWKPIEKQNFTYYTWPSKRPTKLEDIIFYWKLCRKYKPRFSIANFSSVNITLILGYFFGVKNRFAFVRTLYEQLYIDSNNKFKFKLFNLRKSLIYKFFASKILANSLETKKNLIEHNFINDKNILVISNLIKGNEIKYNKIRKNQFVCIGRLSDSKGQSILLENFSKIKNNFIGYKLLLIGNGENYNNLLIKIKELNLEDFVFLMGSLSIDKVYKILAESKIHISSSISEAFGFVNIEAMSSGTPILGPNIGGIKNIIIPGENGEFYDIDNHMSLDKCLKFILNDWEKYSESCVKIFKESFSFESINIRCLKIVDNLKN